MAKRRVNKDFISDVVGELQGPLVRYAHSLVKDRSLAQEIAQDSFLKLWNQPPDNVESYVKEWLFKTCRNQAIDHLRKKGMIREKQLKVEIHLYENENKMEEELISSERMTMINEVIKLLSPEQQEVLRLKFHEGMSYKQIADVTGHTSNHVGVLIHNTLKKLKELIDRKQKSEERSGS